MLNDIASGTNELTADELVPLTWYVCQSSDGRTIPLIPGGQNIQLRRRDCSSCAQKAIEYRSRETNLQVNAVRDGLGSLIPLPILSLMTGERLEQMVCGSSEVHVETLKRIAR